MKKIPENLTTRQIRNMTMHKKYRKLARSLFILFLLSGSTIARAGVNYSDQGYYRVATISPPLRLLSAESNISIMIEKAKLAASQNASVVLFPELSILGYTAQDFYLHSASEDMTRDAVLRFMTETEKLEAVFVLGGSYSVEDRLYNVAFVVSKGRLLGVVPKSFLPNYSEFYEDRWFTSGKDVEVDIQDPLLGNFHFGTKQLFEVKSMRPRSRSLKFGIDICEDVWAPLKPSTQHALAGANLILNLSASNDLVGKHEDRKNLVLSQSENAIVAYAYVSAGPMESTQDTVFGGDAIIAENGKLLSRGKLFQISGSEIYADVDIDKIHNKRTNNKTWANIPAPTGYLKIEVPIRANLPNLAREFHQFPFVPSDPATLEARAEEIMQIQKTGLIRELMQTKAYSEGAVPRSVIGVSGGLDSTLALLVIYDAYKQMGWDTKNIIARTLPGFGTSKGTKTSADELMLALGVDQGTIDITEDSKRKLEEIEHPTVPYIQTPEILREAIRDPKIFALFDVAYENVQARERTTLLFDLANRGGGLVVGTGDLSELALGWCTYNGDHMSSYNVNVGVPKTLVQHLVRWYGKNHPELNSILTQILNTEISPELLPTVEGVVQSTEGTVGSYTLNDFIIYHFLGNRFSFEKIYYLAKQSFWDRPNAGDARFPKKFELPYIKKTLKSFCWRFYTNQFKRTTIPAGPKVGPISVSSRADLRLPNEAAVGDYCKNMGEMIDSLED